MHHLNYVLCEDPFIGESHRSVHGQGHRGRPAGGGKLESSSCHLTALINYYYQHQNALLLNCVIKFTTSLLQARGYAVGAGTAAAAAATSGGALRVLGYNVPWPAIVAGTMAAAMGVYAWGTKHIADVDRTFLN